ncbi:motility protein A [Pseudoalteromonas denitrificans]|uniref:Chemotaxis protein MotA n=1 Tax=Pseudoalteromonas denitrificans DSM 6059 TaxID=1123010 RepID=A0A1I1FLF9_9GAMM|nr:MotA/TolQ/ExbB proton channel family protein [Pseudoalteromonas denitrificans]SFB97880.1 chemotaxis protein MotA [Pseudoalteromonas denitrificans DSM 6059]
MDKASGLGISVIILAIIFAINMSGAEPGIFINIPSIFIVVGGTFGAVMLSYRISHFFKALSNIKLAFSSKQPNLFETLDILIELSETARKKGVLALEDVALEDEMLQKGVNLLLDGHDTDTIEFAFNREILQARQKNNQSIKVLNSFTELAPAMGMIGTLIGLVAMLVSMDDPKSIGPSMSVALLTTLYGALLANGFTGPFANKLGERADEIKQHMMLVRDGILHISRGDNPKLIMEMLASYLGENINSPVSEAQKEQNIA